MASDAPAASSHPEETKSQERCGEEAMSLLNCLVQGKEDCTKRDKVVMVKNEEVIASSASVLEYLSLVKGNRGRMGSMRYRWVRNVGSKSFRLQEIVDRLAKDVFYDINKCDGDNLSSAERASLLARQGVLAYICEPNSLRDILEHNITIAHNELQERMQHVVGDKESKDESTVMICLSWGTAPDQAGGRSAERKYVDVVVHMSAQEIFDDDQTFVRIVKPSKKKTVHDRNSTSSARAGKKESEITIMATSEGRLEEHDFAQLVVVRGKEVIASEEISTDVICEMAAMEFAKRGYTLVRCRLLVDDILGADEVFVVGSLPLCSSVSRVEVEGGDAGDVWERKQKTSLSQSVKESLREAMLAQTT
ncbi:hypothetical protein GUITHDRAFT_160506 [Guillardia theta CCMP2712]|uniref:Uncharacterized protein n=1 Tax=Guillardia theta (strain CCMP2712) TaxID=905079 RepID=L1K2P2_GUITC|nr:hypothetical protein GUITHDRAFT_160506 [Guillardia theta CCMP2712]EKX54725.1 hypothetical protein GUITHDRAFT_160506 [Guillardia theta CCMP2712]|eukprot:XP_005841705.1 hypothetical protein GUITHDRAFT_160506 [Guillardia theta CCMP2712]